MYEWVRIVIRMMRINMNICYSRLIEAYGDIHITTHFDWWRWFIISKRCNSSSHLNIRFFMWLNIIMLSRMAMLIPLIQILLALITIYTNIIMMAYLTFHIISANISLFLTYITYNICLLTCICLLFYLWYLMSKL